MELRHLRYFVAVAEAGSLKAAAQTRLNTAQPSLSRQIRDLEREVGVPLMIRGVQGIVLTAAGHAFLDHARLSLGEAAEASRAARAAAAAVKPVFAVGFLTGQEAAWLGPATRILSRAAPGTEIRISSGFSTNLADDLLRGRIDIAFLRREQEPDLTYRLVLRETLVAIMPRDHPCARHRTLDPRQLADCKFIGVSKVARHLRETIMSYLKGSAVEVVPYLEIDNYAMAISLVMSEGGVALLPVSIEDYLPPTVVSRRLTGKQASVDLVIGHHRENVSPVLQPFLSSIGAISRRSVSA